MRVSRTYFITRAKLRFPSTPVSFVQRSSIFQTKTFRNDTLWLIFRIRCTPTRLYCRIVVNIFSYPDNYFSPCESNEKLLNFMTLRYNIRCLTNKLCSDSFFQLQINTVLTEAVPRRWYSRI